MKSPIQSYIESECPYPLTNGDTLNILEYISQIDRFSPMPATKEETITKVKAWRELLPAGDPAVMKAAIRNYYRDNRKNKSITAAAILEGMLAVYVERDRMLIDYATSHGGYVTTQQSDGLKYIETTPTFTQRDLTWAKAYAYTAAIENKTIEEVMAARPRIQEEVPVE